MRVRSQSQWNLKQFHHVRALCCFVFIASLKHRKWENNSSTMAPMWSSAYDEVSFQKKDLESSSQRAIPGLLEPNHFRIQLMNVHFKSDRAIETVHFATILHFFISHWSVLLKLYTWIKCVSILKRYNNTLEACRQTARNIGNVKIPLSSRQVLIKLASCVENFVMLMRTLP